MPFLTSSYCLLFRIIWHTTVGWFTWKSSHIFGKYRTIPAAPRTAWRVRASCSDDNWESHAQRRSYPIGWCSTNAALGTLIVENASNEHRLLISSSHCFRDVWWIDSFKFDFVVWAAAWCMCMYKHLMQKILVTCNFRQILCPKSVAELLKCILWIFSFSYHTSMSCWTVLRF